MAGLGSAFQDAMRKRPFSLAASALLIATAVANVLFCFVVLLLAAVALAEFGYPVVNNFALLLSRSGL